MPSSSGAGWRRVGRSRSKRSPPGGCSVGGAPAPSPARQVGADEPITVAAPAAQFVSRGGVKLAAALDAFALDVHGRRCLDVGASTGGFTDCLLQRGAAHVVALDVGRGQLAWSLRTDASRHGDGAHQRATRRAGSHRAARPTSASSTCRSSRCGRSRRTSSRSRPTTADFVLLVKPQFEAGGRVSARAASSAIPRCGGPSSRRSSPASTSTGSACTRSIASPITGADGNVEFLAHARRGSA